MATSMDPNAMRQHAFVNHPQVTCKNDLGTEAGKELLRRNVDIVTSQQQTPQARISYSVENSTALRSEPHEVNIKDSRELSSSGSPTRRISGQTEADISVISEQSPERTILLHQDTFTPNSSRGSAEMTEQVSSESSGDDSLSASSPPSHILGYPSRFKNSQNSNEGASPDTRIFLKGPPRKRRRTSPDELQILESEFARNSRPCREDRERIAAMTSKDEKAVQVWFQNKRQSCRRQQNGSGMVPALVRSISYQDENTVVMVPPAMPSNSLPLMNSIHTNGIAMNRPGTQHVSMLASVYQRALESQSINNSASYSHDHMNFKTINENVKAEVVQAKRTKSLKLSMSADGKAQIVERSPLKSLQPNRAAAPAQRFATMPTFSPILSGLEKECASSLLFLKSGQWR